MTPDNTALEAPSIDAALVTFLQETILSVNRPKSDLSRHCDHALDVTIGGNSPVERIKFYMRDVLHVNAHSDRLDGLAEYIWELSSKDSHAAALMIISSRKNLESNNLNDLIYDFVLPEQKRTLRKNREQKLHSEYIHALWKYLIWHSVPKNLRFDNVIDSLALILPHLTEEPIKLSRVLENSAFILQEEDGKSSQASLPRKQTVNGKPLMISSTRNNINGFTKSAEEIAEFLRHAILAGSKEEVGSRDEEVEFRIKWLLKNNFEIDRLPIVMITDPIRKYRCIQFIRHVLPKTDDFPHVALLETLRSFLLAIPIVSPFTGDDLHFLAGAIFAVSERLAAVNTHNIHHLMEVRELEPLHEPFIFQQFIIRAIAPSQLMLPTPGMHITIPAPYSAIEAIGKTNKVATIYGKFLEERLKRKSKEIEALAGILSRFSISAASEAQTLTALVWDFNEVLKAYSSPPKELTQNPALCQLKKGVLTDFRTLSLFLRHVVGCVQGNNRIFANLAHFVIAHNSFGIPLKVKYLLAKENFKPFFYSFLHQICPKSKLEQIPRIVVGVYSVRTNFDRAAELLLACSS